MAREPGLTGKKAGWEDGLEIDFESLNAALEALIVAIVGVQRSRSGSSRKVEIST
jgi:hypothetical protein